MGFLDHIWSGNLIKEIWTIFIKNVWRTTFKFNCPIFYGSYRSCWVLTINKLRKKEKNKYFNWILIKKYSNTNFPNQIKNFIFPALDYSSAQKKNLSCSSWIFCFNTSQRKSLMVQFQVTWKDQGLIQTYLSTFSTLMIWKQSN